MFEIKFRIIENDVELKKISSAEFDEKYGQITGFMQIDFGNDYEGSYYHENPLQKGESGSELLDYWFQHLFNACKHLKKNDYIAFLELGRHNRWIEFRYSDNDVIISLAMDNKSEITDLEITKDEYHLQYDTKFVVDSRLFFEEIERAGVKFVKELYDINPEILNSKMFKLMNNDFIKIGDICEN